MAKQRMVMVLTKALESGDADFGPTEEDDSTKVRLDAMYWDALGNPDEITVTVRDGDRMTPTEESE